MTSDTDITKPIDELALRLRLAGIAVSQTMLQAAAFEFSDMKRHVARVNEALAEFAVIEAPHSNLDERSDREPF